MRKLALRQNEAHLWYADVLKIGGRAALVEGCRQMLSRDELLRSEKILFPSHRTTFVVAKALTRAALAHYLDEPPQALAFARNEYGKPRLAADRGRAPSLRFNLSHAEDAAVLLVKENGEVGVDIECLDRDLRGSMPDIAGMSLTGEEIDSISLAEYPEHRFLEFWTLKEAYVKAIGLGLSANLSGFRFDLADSGAIGFSAKDRSQCLGSNYSFFQSRDVPGHVLSMCLEKRISESEALSIAMVETIPGLDFSSKPLRLSRASAPFHQSTGCKTESQHFAGLCQELL